MIREMCTDGNPARTSLYIRTLSDWSRSLTHPLLALLVLLSLSACTTLGPDFQTPQAPQAEDWLETEETGLTRENTDLTDWWTVFNDPVLDKLINASLDQNLSLQIAGLRIVQARAQLGIARGSMYPQTQSIGGSANNAKISQNSPNASPVQENAFTQYDLGFDAAWELDFWGRFRRGVEAADANLATSIADYQNALVVLTAEVARNYVNVRTFEKRIKLARENIKLQERSLKIATVRFRNGATTELDVQQALSNLSDTQALLPTLEQGLRQSKNALNTLLGKPPGEIDVLLDGPSAIPRAPAQVAIGIPNELLRRRPDVRSAEFNAALQSARIGIAKADLYPSFTLFGSIGYQTSNTGNSSADDMFDSDSITNSIGPGFSWNIFNYGRLKNNVRSQDALFQQAIVNYKNTVLLAYQETEDALIAFLKSQEETKFRQVGAKAAARSAKLANIQYREGAVDFQRVVDSERSLVQQQDQLTSVQGNIALNLIATYKAIGGGWQLKTARPLVPQEMLETMRERTDWGSILPPDDLPDGMEPPPTGSDQPLIQGIDW